MKTTIMTIILAALLVPTIAMAQPGPRGNDCDGNGRHFRGHDRAHMGGMRDGRGHHQGRLLAMADEIGLTDDQVQKIKGMQTDFQLIRIDQRADMQKAQLTIKSLRGQEPVSKTDLFRAIDKAAGMKADMQKASFEHHEAVKAVLTAEQLDKLDKLRAERRMQGRRGRAEMICPYSRW